MVLKKLVTYIYIWLNVIFSLPLTHTPTHTHTHKEFRNLNKGLICLQITRARRLCIHQFNVSTNLHNLWIYQHLVSTSNTLTVFDTSKVEEHSRKDCDSKHHNHSFDHSPSYHSVQFSTRKKCKRYKTCKLLNAHWQVLYSQFSRPVTAGVFYRSCDSRSC